jgi:hypothetical protein
MLPAYLSTAYLGPVQYYCKLLRYAAAVCIETAENYPKQTYRNRCLIAGTNGPLCLSVPVEKGEALKCPTRDVRISAHSAWQRLHWNAMVSAYGASPFFEYYAGDLAPFYGKKKFAFLLDLNEPLRERLCELLDLHPSVSYTTAYAHGPAKDFRETIRPRRPGNDPDFCPQPYYQVFGERTGFLANLSVVDLLFNMGPEAILVLRSSHK